VPDLLIIASPEQAPPVVSSVFHKFYTRISELVYAITGGVVSDILLVA
jgi:hypothetical protein